MFLDPELSTPDDDELCEPWGPAGEPEYAEPQSWEDDLYWGDE